MGDRRNHGGNWSTPQHYAVLARYLQGESLQSIANHMGRTRVSIIGQLSKRPTLAVDIWGNPYPGDKDNSRLQGTLEALEKDLKANGEWWKALSWYHFGDEDHYDDVMKIPGTGGTQVVSEATTEETTEVTIEDTTMKFETIQLLNGRNIKDMSDAEIYKIIADTEHEIERLSAIKARPARLVKLIDQMTKGLHELVDFLNAQDGE